MGGRDRAFAEVRDQFDRWVLDQDAAALEAFLAARDAGRDARAACYFRGYVWGVAKRRGVPLPTATAGIGDFADTMADIDAHPDAFAAFAEGYLAGLRGAEGAR